MKNYTDIKILAGIVPPEPNNFYWADLNEDSSGGVLKVYDISTNKWKQINVTTDEESPTALSDFVNNAGQVKVTYDNLNIIGFESGVSKQFPLHLTTATLTGSPTTKWPIHSPIDYFGGMYIPGNSPETTGRLRENNVLGQVHRWRITGIYTNKTVGNTTSLQIRLYNPNSGFSAVGKNYLPATVTQGDFVFELSTVADNDSLGTGRGYKIDAKVSSDDPTLELTITSILRISEATELMLR